MKRITKEVIQRIDGIINKFRSIAFENNKIVQEPVDIQIEVDTKDGVLRIPFTVQLDHFNTDERGEVWDKSIGWNGDLPSYRNYSKPYDKPTGKLKSSTLNEVIEYQTAKINSLWPQYGDALLNEYYREMERENKFGGRSSDSLSFEYKSQS